jgi:hypothetical protein
LPALPTIDGEAAFEHYVQLGYLRRYADVAGCFGVSVTAVKEHARRHGWLQRLVRIEREAQRRADRRLIRLLVEQRVQTHERVLADLPKLTGSRPEVTRGFARSCHFSA